eukprot:tig00021105_g18279.t1
MPIKVQTEDEARRAHALGLFSAPTYTTIGDPYGQREREKFPLKNSKIDERFKGKQFKVTAPKEGKTLDGLFAENYNVLFNGEPYVDRFKPNGEKKLGFLTSTSPRRDEYTMTISAEQLRELLRKEARVGKSMGQDEWDPSELEPAREPTYTYDILDTIRNKRDYCTKCSRDVFFCRHMNNASPNTSPKKDPLASYSSGHHMLASSAIGWGLDAPSVSAQMKPSPHARRPIVKDSFFRRVGTMNASVST